jgi:hypothetical protein
MKSAFPAVILRVSVYPSSLAVIAGVGHAPATLSAKRFGMPRCEAGSASPTNGGTDAEYRMESTNLY